MDEVKLVLPTHQHREQAEEYKRKSLAEGSHISGSAHLHKYDFDAWLKYCDDLRSGNIKDDLSGAVQYIAIRTSDNKMVGMMQIRHTLTPFLEKYGGHVGYSVAPDERGKGYATAMVKLAMTDCKKHGITDVLISCRKSNIASRRVIEKCGGRFANEVEYEDVILTRYWVKLT